MNTPAARHVRRVRSAGRWLRLGVLCALAAVAAAHAAVTSAATGEIDPIVAAVDGALALLLLVAAVAHIRTLGRERTHHAVVEELVAALDVPRTVEDAAAAATTLLVETGVAQTALVAVAYTPAPGEDGGDGGAETLLPLAAVGYPEGWLRDAPSRPPIAGRRAPLVERPPAGTPWSAAAGRRWMATVPLWRGDELLGEIVLTADRRGLLGRPALLLTIGSVTAAALDAARLHQAAFEETRSLEQQEARRRDFLYAIAHELRTPLTSIQTFADLLQAERVDDPAAELLLTSLSRGVSRLSSLVNDLLDLGRVEGSDVALQVTAVDMCRVLRNAEAILRPSFMSRRQQLELDLPPRRLLAMGDERALEQVVLNLLSNAHRFTPEQGRVVVRAGQQGDRVRVDVEDSGPGIAAADRHAIFQPFYRVQRPGAPQVPGSGLGLAVARRLMELQSGQIWVDPVTDGPGSRFSITIPAVPPAEALRTEPPARAEDAAANGG